MDPISVERAKKMHPLLRDEVLQILQEMTDALKGRAIPRLSYTLRTFAEQDVLYAQGRTKKFDANGHRLGIVTNARGGQSPHNYGLAFDICLLVDTNGDGKYDAASWDTHTDFDGDKKPDWRECVDIVMAHPGWEWGGNFKSLPDEPHFQKMMNYPIALLRSMYDNKAKLDAEGYLKFG
jgi:peptidoglycan L-alanyl-D-glutamate endopeptidase CwlK